MCACPLIEGESESKVTQLCLTPWTIACQAPSFQDFPGKNTGVGCCFLLQGIFPTQESNPGFLPCRQTLYWLSYKGSPEVRIGTESNASGGEVSIPGDISQPHWRVTHPFWGCSLVAGILWPFESSLVLPLLYFGYKHCWIDSLSLYLWAYVLN